jgi:hypothetical protein
VFGLISSLIRILDKPYLGQAFLQTFAIIKKTGMGVGRERKRKQRKQARLPKFS